MKGWVEIVILLLIGLIFWQVIIISHKLAVTYELLQAIEQHLEILSFTP